jgi:hypothetical protein
MACRTLTTYHKAPSLGCVIERLTSIGTDMDIPVYGATRSGGLGTAKLTLGAISFDQGVVTRVVVDDETDDDVLTKACCFVDGDEEDFEGISLGTFLKKLALTKTKQGDQVVMTAKGDDAGDNDDVDDVGTFVSNRCYPVVVRKIAVSDGEGDSSPKYRVIDSWNDVGEGENWGILIAS